MGRKSGTESIVAIVRAFLDKRTWTQAALARQTGLTVPSLRRRLDELREDGFPLERQEDHPHVWWSVPKGWMPGGVAFDQEDASHLLRVLLRSPRSTRRDRLIDRIVRTNPADREPPRRDVHIVSRATPAEETILPVLEDAAAKRQSLRIHYYTASRGVMEWRHVSVQRIAASPPARFVAVCHRAGALKWFRVDGVFAASLDPHEAFRTAQDEDIDGFVKASVDAFHDGPEIECSFFVHGPDARWVAKNLPTPMVGESVDGGLRVCVRTAGVLRVARFVVGLGASARCESPELAAAVRTLAEGALAARAKPLAATSAERTISRA